MVSKYDEQILQYLHHAGERGMSVHILSKNVYNENTSLFDELTYEDVYRYVRSYIQRNTKSSDSLIESAGQRGYYRLNNTVAQQLLFDFTDAEDQDSCEDSRLDVDLSLSLF